jgi:uncharacterized metal-binding protein YceD (DUF177 family)
LSNWPKILKLGEVPQGGLTVLLTPDAAACKEIAAALDLLAMDQLSARVRVIPWLDGIQMDGEFSATVVQTCGVTLERLENEIEGDFMVRAVPQGSVHAPDDEEEIDLSLDADDPPDVLEYDQVDLSAYVVEHLALAIDPFPRKPGAEFVQNTDEPELSPFAALKALRQDSKD